MVMTHFTAESDSSAVAYFCITCGKGPKTKSRVFFNDKFDLGLWCFYFKMFFFSHYVTINMFIWTQVTGFKAYLYEAYTL